MLYILLRFLQSKIQSRPFSGIRQNIWVFLFCYGLLGFSAWNWTGKYSRNTFYIPHVSTLRPVCGVVSIKVDVRLMFFPASWAQHDHMEVEMFPFFLSLLANQLSWKEPELWRDFFFSAKETEGEKNKHVISTWLSAFLLSNPSEQHENQRPRSTLIEARLKHANALILFSFGATTWRWLVVWFSHAWNRSVWTAATCVSAFWCLTEHLSLSNHLGTLLDVYFGRNPIMHSCLFPLVWQVAPVCHVIQEWKEHACIYNTQDVPTSAICTFKKKSLLFAAKKPLWFCSTQPWWLKAITPTSF